jgi:hypothetical protein
MQKNVSGQKLIAFAFDSTTNLPKTGDAANLTAYVSKDYGAVTVLGDTTATEMDATNAKGYYLFDLTQAETNADTLLFSAKSSTANIVVIGVPATAFTTPPNFNLESIDGNGRLDVININGTSQTARDIGASVLLAANQHVIVDSGTVTTLTTLPAIPSNWLTAAGIAAAALNGKGDWPLNTDYTQARAVKLDDLDATVSSRLASASYTAPDNASIATIVTDVNAGAGAIYNRIGAPAGASIAADIAAVNAKTTNIPSAPAAVGSAMTLANGAITDATITFPAEAVGRPTTFLAAMRRAWEWVANKRTRDRTTGIVLLRNAADSGTLETQTQDTAGTVDSITQGA